MADHDSADTSETASCQGAQLLSQTGLDLGSNLLLRRQLNGRREAVDGRADGGFGGHGWMWCDGGEEMGGERRRRRAGVYGDHEECGVVSVEWRRWSTKIAGDGEGRWS